MRSAGFGKMGGFGAKGMAAKGGFFKGIFGFFGGILKFMFFGFFLLIFLIVGLVMFFSMKKKMENQKFRDVNSKDDIIDAEIIDSHPIKK
jgi:uncharacterized membrane protein